MQLGFIGGGVMTAAIIAGIRNASIKADIVVGEPVQERRDALIERYMVAATAQNAEAVDGADIVVLAVKPQQLEAMAAELAPLLAADQTVLSIMAGVKIHSLGLKLNHGRIIRVMPNTPAQVGRGMSVWTAWGDVPQGVIEFTGRMLDGMGEQIYLEDEKLVDMATALSASGPAYVFTFIESLADAGVDLVGGVRSGLAPDSGGITLAWSESAPVDVLVRHFLKRTDNLYGESLVKQMGYVWSGRGTWPAGLSAVRRSLSAMVGIDSTTYRLADGSGLSRYSEFSPRMLATVVAGAYASFEIGPEFAAALPIGGTDGTLSGRMGVLEVPGCVRAKTGTMSGVTCLAGLVETEDGERLAFALMMNGFIGSARPLQALRQPATQVPAERDDRLAHRRGRRDARSGPEPGAEVQHLRDGGLRRRRPRRRSQSRDGLGFGRRASEVQGLGRDRRGRPLHAVRVSLKIGNQDFNDHVRC